MGQEQIAHQLAMAGTCRWRRSHTGSAPPVYAGARLSTAGLHHRTEKARRPPSELSQQCLYLYQTDTDTHSQQRHTEIYTAVRTQPRDTQRYSHQSKLSPGTHTDTDNSQSSAHSHTEIQTAVRTQPIDKLDIINGFHYELLMDYDYDNEYWDAVRTRQ